MYSDCLSSLAREIAKNFWRIASFHVHVHMRTARMGGKIQSPLSLYEGKTCSLIRIYRLLNGHQSMCPSCLSSLVRDIGNEFVENLVLKMSRTDGNDDVEIVETSSICSKVSYVPWCIHRLGLCNDL